MRELLPLLVCAKNNHFFFRPKMLYLLEPKGFSGFIFSTKVAEALAQFLI